jgi:phage terminase large subunit GpA-like protein
MSKTLTWSKAVLADVFRPKPNLRIWEWLERNCKIPTATGSPRPGRFNINSAPLLKRWFDAYQDDDTRFISFAKSARVGGTMFGILCDLWVISEKPGPILWVYPNAQSARDDSQKDIQPFYLNCKPVDNLRSKTKEGWTRLFMFFRDNYVKLVGSNSPMALAGSQAQHLRINEVDKLTDSPGKEAPPAELALARTIMYPDSRKILRNSTPTEPSALAWRYFKEGSEEYAYLPCPFCKQLQRLTFFKEDRYGLDGKKVLDEQGNPLQTGQVLFSHLKEEGSKLYDLTKVKEGAVYECEECKGHIKHSQLNSMMVSDEARWVKHNPNHPAGVVSGHITTLYSTFFSWGWIASEWITAKDNPGSRQHFYNSILGLPFEHTKTTLNLETIKSICRTSPKYKRTTLGNNKLPARPSLICMQVDVQGQATGMWWTIVMWDEDWNMYVLDWASKEARGFGDLDQILERVWEYEGEVWEIAQVAIDSGHRTQEVYDWCEQHAGICIPTKGYDTGKNGGILRPVIEQPIEDRQLTLVQFQDRYFKSSLYQHSMTFRNGRGFYIPEWETKEGMEDGTDREFVIQLTNERCDAEGNWVGVTSKRPDWNHLGDCLKQAKVQDHVFDIERRLQVARKEEEEMEKKRVMASEMGKRNAR